MSEQSPLVPVPHQRYRSPKYRLTCIRSRAAVLVLLWDLLFHVYTKYMFFFFVILLYMLTPNGGTIYLLSRNLFFIPYLFYPVGGLIADVWIGRYRMIIISICICLVSLLFTAIEYSLHWYNNELYPVSITILILTACLFVSGSAGFQSNILPFNIDQMMGASGDQLSAVIHWHMFGSYILYSVPTPEVKSLSGMFFILPSLVTASYTITLVSQHLFKHWLDTTPQITNPIKLILKVLNYAMKNKYPRNRSALTYWQNDYPPRLDLGKEKYGGPFSEEEVEDVKTVLRLLPLVIIIIGFPISWGAYNIPLEVSGFGGDDMSRFLKFYIEDIRIPFLVCCVLIIFYQFIIYPCFYKYIPSMLKRIGMGLVFGLLAVLFIIAIDIWFGDFSDPSFHCQSIINNHSNTSSVMVVNYKWILIPHITFGCALVLVSVTALEFTIAQSPRQMRGLMVGLCYATYGIGVLVSTGLAMILLYFESGSRGCVLYYHLGNTLLILFTLILFIIFAKYYKFRVRDNIVPVYDIVASHYEKYMEQREEQSSSYDSISIQ